MRKILLFRELKLGDLIRFKFNWGGRTGEFGSGIVTKIENSSNSIKVYSGNSYQRIYQNEIIEIIEKTSYEQF